MPTTILLIENDAAFAREIIGGARGDRLPGPRHRRRQGGARPGPRRLPPAPSCSASSCRRCPATRSAEAQEGRGAQGHPPGADQRRGHRRDLRAAPKLKARAEDYLLKPYVSAALLEKVAGLVGLPGGGASHEPPAASAPAPDADGGDEEVVSLEEELGFEAFAGEPGEELPALDLDSLPDEPSAASVDAGLDERPEAARRRLRRPLGPGGRARSSRDGGSGDVPGEDGRRRPPGGRGSHREGHGRRPPGHVGGPRGRHGLAPRG